MEDIQQFVLRSLPWELQQDIKEWYIKGNWPKHEVTHLNHNVESVPETAWRYVNPWPYDGLYTMEHPGLGKVFTRCCNLCAETYVLALDYGAIKGYEVWKNDGPTFECSDCLLKMKKKEEIVILSLD